MGACKKGFIIVIICEKLEKVLETPLVILDSPIIPTVP